MPMPMPAPVPAPLPVHCRGRAFEALARQLDDLDTTAGLVRCAAAVAMHQMDDIEPLEIEAALSALADDVADRLQHPTPQAVLAHAHAVLFEQMRFRGNVRNYYDPRNSLLPAVLRRRVGLPISLSLVYKAVLERLGLRVEGINAPGHFLVAIHAAEMNHHPERAMLVDPFHGGKVLSRDEAYGRIEEVAGGRVERTDDLLQIATHEQWLLRLLQNLIGAFSRAERKEDAAAMLELRALVESRG